jgi:hypothetical protein
LREAIDVACIVVFVSHSLRPCHAFCRSTPRDGYFTFGEIDQKDPTVYEDTFVLYAQSFIDFVKSKGVLVDPPLSEIFDAEDYLLGWDQLLCEGCS